MGRRIQRIRRIEPIVWPAPTRFAGHPPPTPSTSSQPAAAQQDDFDTVLEKLLYYEFGIGNNIVPKRAALLVSEGAPHSPVGDLSGPALARHLRTRRIPVHVRDILRGRLRDMSSTSNRTQAVEKLFFQYADYLVLDAPYLHHSVGTLFCSHRYFVAARWRLTPEVFRSREATLSALEFYK